MGNMMLFYVGAVLFCNGLWILGHIEDREIAVIDFFIGALGCFVSLYAAITGDYFAGATTFLFAFTYLWVALNRYLNVDGRGLGWFSLFVAVSVFPIGLWELARSGGQLMPTWSAINWLSWAILWFMYWVLLARQKASVGRAVGWMTLIMGIYTGWIPGWLLLMGIV